MSEIKIKLNGRLARFQRLLRGQEPGIIARVFAAFSRIYSAFIRARFVRASRGDGTWKPLAESTIKARRKGKKSKKGAGSKQPAILRDTGLMFSQLHPQIEAPTVLKASAVKFEAVVGFGGTAKYPGGLTTSDVMGFHQTGGGNLPQRKILVDADVKTKQQMATAGARIIKDELK